MNLIGVIALGLLGLLGAYFFLIFGEQQQSDQQRQAIEHKIGSEKFDKDFNAAWNGKPLENDAAARQARIAALENELAEIRQQQDAKKAENKKREAELLHSLDQLAGH